MEGIVADRTYFPGDVIYTEKCFAKVVKRSLNDVICEFCCRQTPSILKYCKQCLAIKYCGKECQKRDWNDHKLECKLLKNLPKDKAVDLVRLIGRIILKLKEKDWTLVKSTVFKRDVTFDDVDSRYRVLMQVPRMNLYFKEMKELIENYIGLENMPDDEDLAKIVGKVRFNAFINKYCITFFIGVSVFGLECIPNSNTCIFGDTAKIWACKKIIKGRDEVTVTFRKILSIGSFHDDNDLKSCMCSDCSLPFGESVLFKITDKKGAFSVINDTERFIQATEVFSDFCLFPESSKCLDILLRKQKQVLGNTNYLHMKLLALKCFNSNLHPLEVKEKLMELEESMRSVFGEYYIEMLHIYKCLIVANIDNPAAIAAYALKLQRIERHIFQS